jgi:hypothetical protein
MWAEGFDRLAISKHLRLIVLAKDGCPPWLAKFPTSSGGPFPQCDSWHQFVVHEIGALHPSIVIVTGGTGESWSPAGDERGLIDLVDAIKHSGSRVAILSNMPWFPTAGAGTPVPPDCLIQHSTRLKVCDLGTTVWHRSQSSFRSTLVAGATRSGVRFVDLDPLYCTTQSCPVVVAGHQVYFDIHHMMASYGTFIEPALATLLQPVLPK